jgi:hypothetical protein
VAIQNSAYLMGDMIFSDLLGPVMQNYLDDYHQMIMFSSIIPGETSWSHQELDYRSTMSPVIRSDSIDIFIIGNFVYNVRWDWQKKFWPPFKKYHPGTWCQFEPQPMDFVGDET